MFGRNRRAEAEALNEMRAEMIAAAGDRAKLAQVLQKLEVTLTADFDRQARERATTELGVENLRQSVNGHTTALAEAVQQVASMCALLAERIESERLERHALIEALAALRTAPTPELGRGTDEPRVVGGNVFTSRDQAVEADVVIIDEPGDGTQPPLALGNLVRCRFGDQWIDDLEVCEVIDDWKPVRYRLRRTADKYMLPARFTRNDIEFIAASAADGSPRRRWSRS